MHISVELYAVLKGSGSKRKFLDSLRLYVKGGTGGMGSPKYGGIGGAGGDVYVKGNEGITLKNLVKKYPIKRIAAGHGENANARRIVGHKGEDVTIETPIGVSIYDQVGNKICEINAKGDTFKVISGGLGGRPETGFSGLTGDSQILKFDLKLIADVGLIGFPNAGKSTLLSKISNAKPKIASYPFTTIQPQIGVIKYDDYRSITVADLPGLIEGAHINIGMGHKFLKHIERTKLLLVVVDVGGFRLSPKYSSRTCLETIILLNKELELYRQELLNYPAMLVINKMDKDGSNEIYKTVTGAIKSLKDVFKEVPESIRPVKPFEFQRIIGISLKDENPNELSLVKKYIREILDENTFENVTEKELELIESFKSKIKEKSPMLV